MARASGQRDDVLERLVVRRLAVLLAVITAAVGLGVSPTSAALPAPHTEVVLDGEAGEPVTQGARLRFTDVVAVIGFEDTTVSLDVSAGGVTRTIALAAPVGQPIAVGAYEQAARTNLSAAGRPGLSVTGGGVGCNTVSGRFVVDQLVRDQGGLLQAFSARFEHHCEGAEPALFGSVSYNGTADFRTRTISTNAVAFADTVTGATSPASPVLIENRGPSSLAVADVRIIGTGASQFRADTACVGVTLALGAGCTVHITFTPSSAGQKSARLLLVDDSLPPGDGSGRDIVLTGNALRGVDPFGELTALTPARILDTRSGLGGVTTPAAPGATFDVTVAGRAGIPVSGVLAVVMNVTVTAPTEAGFLTVWPSGIEQPGISNVNFAAGQTVANLAIVALGDGGQVSIFNERGTAHVLLDVVGFYADVTGPLGSRFHPMAPQRSFDTRDGTGGVAVGPLGAGSTLTTRVVERLGVPAGATAIVMNVTVDQPTESGYLTVFPADVERPTVSNLNFAPGQTVANMITVRVPPSGRISFFNETGTVNLLADVVGWYGEDRSGEAGRYVPLTPTRVFDSRVASPFGDDGAIPEGELLVQTQTPSGAGALVYNVTAVAPTAAGYVTVFPDRPPVPLASNLNFTPGRNVPNLVIVRRGDNGWILFFNSAGRTHLLIDVFGAFTNGSVAPQAVHAELASSSIDRGSS